MEDKISVARIGGEHAGYLFDFRRDGVYLTVFPQVNSGIMFELSDMRQILAEYSVTDYNVGVLAHAVRECSGRPQRIGSIFTLPKDWKQEEQGSVVEEIQVKIEAEKHIEYGQAIIEVASDKMSARLKFDLSGDKAIPTKDMIYDAINLRNIRYGLNEEAVNQAMEQGKPMVIAKGDAPQHGTDAQIIKKYDMEEKGRPQIDSNNRVDYRNLNIFIPAVKGQVLAVRIPHTRGINGTNVFGDNVFAKNGKPKPLPSGKNTSIKDENYLISDLDGQIVENGNKISVDPCLKINGDVGVGTGNIDFDGAVSIDGSVMAGFTVKATGDVEITGMIAGGTVEGRNVYVNGGIQGGNHGYVKAAEDIRASFVENGELEAGSDIYISDSLIHSVIRAGYKLIMVEGRGRIIGGTVAAGEEINAINIGNVNNIVTKLVVGVNPMLQKEYQNVLREYNESKKRLEQLTRTLNTLGKLDLKQLPEDKVARINELVRSQFPLAGKVERSEKKLKEIDSELQKMRNGKIRAKEKIYPGVRMSINSIVKAVQNEETYCTQYVQDDFVVIGPY